MFRSNRLSAHLPAALLATVLSTNGRVEIFGLNGASITPSRGALSLPGYSSQIKGLNGFDPSEFMAKNHFRQSAGRPAATGNSQEFKIKISP